MPAQPKHRDKIIRAAALLFRRTGYSAAGMNDIVALSGAPKGSVYHYFPGGKEQVAQEALVYAAGLVTQTLTELAEKSSSAAEMLRSYAGMLSQWLAKSDYQDGCPVTTTLLETAATIPNMSELGRQVFGGWQEIFTAKLISDGLTKKRAASLAALAISSLEGALILARVEHDAGPITTVALEVADLFATAVAARRATKA